MFRIGVKREFDAAHKLEGHPGKCSQLHGHTWTVEVVFMNESLDDLDFVLDFDQAGSVLDDVISSYDHVYLNEISPFNSITPTAENIARIIFTRLSDGMESVNPDVVLESVKVWESNYNWAMYSAG